MSNASTLSVVLMVASAIIAVMVIHYGVVSRRSPDVMCVAALFATMFGLNLGARAAEAPGPLWQVAMYGVFLFLFGALAWWGGLTRFRAGG